VSRKPEALPYYERLLKEFEQSEYLERAKKRVDELKNTAMAKPDEAKKPEEAKKKGG
jgi:hypothetical protein